ncbi:MULTISPECIES: type II secretion system protein XpsN [Xanthomonas]|uniref:General secretion pathway protein XpsN n=1 Tax=Xanthomonas rydalmerensis TaxID=3046274 RepID=A0ABZ0JKC5_9XANT|nr:MULTISPECIES: type II secretion system protein XpsN [unclassified Xanthomonas]MBB5877101.1 general secretion pathway protein N [Xanthomonas sp. 3498]WOS40253.1 general secretion pathway protein XpsN [Xanthomonas sp. DM-2023]WOS44437.1 general secretion pathway protein XpsN [Xanthomonas sp. DM-2023]WOS48617.1 general secretion pathway protein XpsN [Xanthomonas sp. DM-2023]WOS52797.1 general secretion pathway protein XpsN [Xanthomonas sp. DM-2023]
MRIEAMGLRTVWLGTLALWGLLVWALGLGGLGERVAPLPDDPSMLQRLPGLPAASTQRLGDFSQYGEIAARPVFAEDRRPHPFFLSADSGQSAAPNVRLTGVLLTDGFKMATLTTEQGESLRLQEGGAAVQGWRLLSLAPRQATVSGSGGTQTLELKVFDGKGGQPPTVLGQAGRTAAGQGQMPPPASAPNGQSNATAPRPPTQSAPNPVPNQAPTPSAPAPSSPAPSSEQLQAIRERIEARRRQLQQQRQNNPSGQNP